MKTFEKSELINSQFRFVFQKPSFFLVFPPPCGAGTHKRIGI